MKFPSVYYLITQAVDAFKRFYLPLLFAIVGTVFGVLLIENNADNYFRILYTCALCIPLSLGSVLLTERRNSLKFRLVAPFFCIGFALLYGLWLVPSEPNSDYRFTVTSIVLMVVMHLFVAVAPYIGQKEPMGFWRFNETLFVRVFLSGIFCGVLFVGLALAIVACRELLNLKVGSNAIADLFVVVIGIFNTLFFLAGIPSSYAELNSNKEFPKMLKMFTQYILMPLVALYIIILYVYGIKIVVQWRLPNGEVSLLIMCYSVLGILALLLVTPLRNDTQSPWVRLFFQFFFIASLPLIALLYVAIITRASIYGITEPRYYLLLLGAWLGFLSVYFIFSPSKNIKVIPSSLGLLGLLSLFGPWSAFAVSEWSQISRLDALLIKNKVWKPGEKVSDSPPLMQSGDNDNVHSIVEYLVNSGKLSAMQKYFAEDLRLYKPTDGYNPTGKITSMLCTGWGAAGRNEKEDFHYRECVFNIDERKVIDMLGYTKAYQITVRGLASNGTQFIHLSATDSLEVSISHDEDVDVALDFLRNGKPIESIPLKPIINELTEKRAYFLSPQELTLYGKGALKSRVIITAIHLGKPYNDEDIRFISDLRVLVLLP